MRSSGTDFHVDPKPMKFSSPGIILIVIGVLLLLRNLGLFNIDLVPLLRTWWPLILVLVGASMLFKARQH